jgi:CheY-like chemotaxis protein
MNEIIKLISENNLYLGLLALSFLIIGFVIGKFILSPKKEKLYDNEMIQSYIDEVVEGEMQEAKEKAEAEEKENQPQRERNPDEAPKVLIAEDNLVNAKILIKLLTKYGIDNYKHVLDGQLAFEERKEVEDYDIILMDINMPNMTGDEATQAIIKWEKENNKPHVPIIAVTANALKGDREKYINAGMDDYTTKPIKMNKVSELILKYTGFKGIE